VIKEKLALAKIFVGKFWLKPVFLILIYYGINAVANDNQLLVSKLTDILEGDSKQISLECRT